MAVSRGWESTKPVAQTVAQATGVTSVQKDLFEYGILSFPKMAFSVSVRRFYLDGVFSGRKVQFQWAAPEMCAVHCIRGPASGE